MHYSIVTARSMVEQLEKVDPSQLTHDEKLAFWINVHNALLMHVISITQIVKAIHFSSMKTKCSMHPRQYLANMVSCLLLVFLLSRHI